MFDRWSLNYNDYVVCVARSTIEESRNDSGNSNAQAGNSLECLNCYLDGLDFRNQESKKSPEKSTERCSRKNEISHSVQARTPECNSSSSTHEHGCNGEMERAIKHQAQLISCHEAQEKAQRDWEEKYGEINVSMLFNFIFCFVCTINLYFASIWLHRKK